MSGEGSSARESWETELVQIPTMSKVCKPCYPFALVNVSHWPLPIKTQGQSRHLCWILYLSPSVLQSLDGFFSPSLVDSLIIQTAERADIKSGAIALGVSLQVTR